MTAAAFFPWLAVAWLLARTGKASAAPAATPSAPAVKRPPAAKPPPTVVQTPTGTVPAVHKPSPQPWPQAVPAGLPGFPGPGWVPDNPPGAGVVARASQLIPVLWARGAGTYKVEQTAGRWICYRATPMGSKKGVVAFRLASDVPTVAPTPPASAPNVVPAVHKPAPAPASAPQVVPASLPAPAPKVGLKTLRLTSPRTTGPDVVTLQRRLGITADGVFGSGTHASVIAYQRSHGLAVDGIVGPKTWASLFGR